MLLLEGDCIELLRDIPDASVDLVLTDPPYGTTANEWDTAFSIPWDELNRITKPHAPIVLFSQLPFVVLAAAYKRGC